MCDPSQAVNNATAVFNGTLVVGNHDTITLLGIQEQNRLRDYSRKLSALYLKNTMELDNAIADVLAEIEHFESRATLSSKSVWGKNRIHKEITKAYSRILSYIENVTLYFKLQQVQLMKEIKLLEKMEATIADSSKEISNCIELGKRVLTDRADRKSGESIPSVLGDDSDNDLWYSRLDKRINDLLVSHTVALQIQTQIKMLHESNLLMLDRIGSVVSNVFPIWQSQISVMLGIGLLESRLDNQTRILDATEKHITETSVKIKTSHFPRNTDPLDIEKMIEANNALKEALNEIAAIENNDGVLRQNLQETTHYTEGGQNYE